MTTCMWHRREDRIVLVSESRDRSVFSVVHDWMNSVPILMGTVAPQLSGRVVERLLLSCKMTRTNAYISAHNTLCNELAVRYHVSCIKGYEAREQSTTVRNLRVSQSTSLPHRRGGD